MNELPGGYSQVNVRFPLELAQRLWGRAKAEERTVTAYVRMAVAEKLAREAPQPKRKGAAKS